MHILLVRKRGGELAVKRFLGSVCSLDTFYSSRYYHAFSLTFKSQFKKLSIKWVLGLVSRFGPTLLFVPFFGLGPLLYKYILTK